MKVMPLKENVSLEPLSRSECLDRLSSASIGRVAVVVDGAPHMFLVNYVLDGETVVFCTTEECLRAHAGLTEVGFEVDDLDATRRLGWSVCVEGLCHDITEAIDATSERLRNLSLVTWMPDQREPGWFAIRPHSMNGRQLRVLPSL
jgi:nitroimidazol reductase NimA-like FMN-containing flavoprotein (pyridoxamine 5'-phosphate oxidase superfamily)